VTYQTLPSLVTACDQERLLTGPPTIPGLRFLFVSDIAISNKNEEQS